MIPTSNIVNYFVAYLSLYVVILFALIFVFNRNLVAETKKRTDWEPKISVIIPAYNCEKSIGRCIESVLDSEYPKEKLEILVVDDGSKDNTYKTAKKYEMRGVKVFTKENSGTAAGPKNYGIKRATGEIIATLDGDSYISRDAIRKLLPLFEDKDVVAVTSAIKASNTDRFFSGLQKVEYLLTVFSRRVLSTIDCVFVTPGPFSLFRAWVFDKIGGFDETNILEDQEIALRIQKHNYKIRSSLDAEVFTEVPETFTSLVKQRTRWHRGGLKNTIKYFELLSPKYGDLGLVIMPLSIIAILSIFLVLFMALYNIIFGAVTSRIFISNLFLSFEPLYFISAVILLVTLGFTYYSLTFFKKEKINPLMVVVYIAVYAYLITIYWILAVGKEIKGERLSW